MSCTISAAIH